LFLTPKKSGIGPEWCTVPLPFLGGEGGGLRDAEVESEVESAAAVGVEEFENPANSLGGASAGAEAAAVAGCKDVKLEPPAGARNEELAEGFWGAGAAGVDECTAEEPKVNGALGAVDEEMVGVEVEAPKVKLGVGVLAGGAPNENPANAFALDGAAEAYRM
jgi:hypothetical protein